MAKTIASRKQQHKSYPKAIIYGAPKSGKSLGAGKLAEKYNLLWFDLENGSEVLEQLPTEWQERVQLVDIPDTRDYPIAIETMLKVVKGKATICDEHGKVNCMVCGKKAKDEGLEVADYATEVDVNNLPDDTIVVIDSLTQLTNSAIAQITRNKPDDYKLNYDDWSHLGMLLDRLLSYIQQAKYKVVVITHEVETETESGKTIIVPLGGTRNFARNLAKYFGHVVYAERKLKKHVFSSSTTDSTTVLSGSRTSVDLQKDGITSLLPIFEQADIANAKVKEVPKKSISTTANNSTKSASTTNSSDANTKSANVSTDTASAADKAKAKLAALRAKTSSN